MDTLGAVAPYLFNVTDGDAERAAAQLRSNAWPVGVDERHRASLSAGDVALVYVAAERAFIAHVVLASAVRSASDDVSLADVEWWEPPAPMDEVLTALGPSENAKSEFDTGVLRITDPEYEAAVGVARRRGAV
jgi:hypothetical protein